MYGPIMNTHTKMKGDVRKPDDSNGKPRGDEQEVKERMVEMAAQNEEECVGLDN